MRFAITYMFLEGKDGADAEHFHISVGEGNALGNNGTGWITNNLGEWVLQTSGSNLKPEQAFYIDATFTSVANNGGISFAYKK